MGAGEELLQLQTAHSETPPQTHVGSVHVAPTHLHGVYLAETDSHNHS